MDVNQIYKELNLGSLLNGAQLYRDSKMPLGGGGVGAGGGSAGGVGTANTGGGGGATVAGGSGIIIVRYSV